MALDKNICVFCGSSTRVDEKYLTLARETGIAIARAGFGVVYGGSRMGMMGAVADAALKEQGRVIGVIPHFLKKLEVAHTGLSELHMTETMHERQMGMAERADGFLVLPGGLGTLAEFFEILTWRSLSLHEKPIGLVNFEGYWDDLLAFEDHAKKELFVRENDRKLFIVLENQKDLAVFLDQFKVS